MDSTRTTVVAVVTVIFTVTLVSGPLVSAVDLTRERSPGIGDEINTGSASIDVQSFPETASISKGRFGSDTYYLKVPDARIDVQNVTGRPTLLYKIQVDTLWTSTSTVSFLSSGTSGEATLSIGDKTLDAEDLQAEQYNATITLLLRGEETITLREESVVIEVER